MEKQAKQVTELETIRQRTEPDLKMSDKKEKVTPPEKEVAAHKKAASFFQLQYALSKKFDNIVLICGLIGSLGMGVSMPLFSVIFGGSINAFGSSQTANSESFINDIHRLCLNFVYVGLGIWVAGYLMIWLWGYNGRIIAKRLKKRYFALLMSQEQGYFDQRDTNEFATKIQAQVKAIEMGIGDKIGNTIMAFSMTIGSFVVGFTYSWKLSLVLVSIIPVLMVAAVFMITTIRTSSVKNRQAYEKAGGIAEEILKNIKTVTSFANYEYEENRFGTRLEESYVEGVAGGVKSGFTMGFLFFTVFASYTLAIWFGSKLISEKEFNSNTGKPFAAGDVLTVLFTIVFGAFSLGQAAPNKKAVIEAMNAAYEFFELLKRQPKIKKSPNDIFPNKESILGKIEFKNVNFAYPIAPDTKILNNLNLTFEQSKVTAIVGMSGSGKSTIANLVERLYELEDGQIYLDSHDISTIDLKYLRSMIGYVAQEPVLLNTTIRDNIIFGRENITDEQVWAACKKAMADEFIVNKEEGLDYIVGLKGSKLSGGQKQRVAIARAILTQPKILILDEATSALDNKYEKEVQMSLNRVSKGVTTIVIAHRLSTIINADKIIVLEKGKIIEEGNHKSLLALEGSYANLIRSQIGTADYNPELVEIQIDSQENVVGGPENIPTSNRPDGEEIKLNSEVKEIPKSKIKRKNSFEELEDQIKAERARKSEFEKLADQKKGRLWPILKEQCGVILWAAFFASMAGVVWPVYGILLADSISSLSNTDLTVVKNDGFMLAMYFLLLAGAAGVSMFFQNFLFVKIGEHMTRGLRKLVFNRYLRLNMSFYDVKTNTPGALATQLSSDTTKTNSIALSMVGISVQTIATLIIALTLGFVFEWRLSLINIGLLPLMIGSSVFHFKLQQGFSSVDEIVEASAGGVVSESVGNTKTLYCYNMQPKVVRMYNKILKNGMRTINKTSFVNGILFGFSQFVMFITYAIIFYAGGSFMYQGTLDMKSMFRAIFVLLFAGFGLGQAQQYVSNISEAKSALVNIFKTIEEPSTIDPIEIRDRNPPAHKPQNFKGEIEFKNVTFRYNETQGDVLKGVSFKIEAGQRAAFVGSSGSGKSTIVQLIERFYDANEGQILIDGVDIKDYDLIWLRHNMSCVLQEPILFQKSIMENIRYGNLNATDEEVHKCARQAHIEDKLKEDATINVSGGEKQRLALARAMINNPRILLFDEFTSALNSDLEKAILANLDELLGDRTSITIAHRLSTIEKSDVIFVLDNGKILEQGNHSQLYEMKGKYHHLYNAGNSELKKSTEGEIETN